MIVNLHRSFSEHTTAATDSDEQDVSLFFDQHQGRLTWTNLHEKQLVVVLGEAGIGKTIEFQNEVNRLLAANQAAFFLPLNQLSDAASWQMVLTGHNAEFAAWAASEELGYFFLDAVDEARLKSHSDFEKALKVVQRELGQNLARVRIAISSRVTDWSTPGVRSAVATLLAKPIERALATKDAAETLPPSPDSNIGAVPAIDVGKPVEAVVVRLDPLSKSEAHRCATAFGLEDEVRFWTAVADGDYEFMATRPLDLRWMVELWNQRRSLGNYRELIEVNIANRLRELNESYEAAGEVLSVSQLHAGAIELAAAAEFGGCAFFALDPGATPTSGELAPNAVLADWPPTAVRRLLATAVFDEASFGRVQFHHRSIREFLAAQWVAKQLALGVPLLRLQSLFSASPYGKTVLIPSRRATLSWLAAIDVAAREWVVREFPEILLFEGDPQAWDRISADKAFEKLIQNAKEGLQLSWYSSASEFMRMGRALGGGKVAGALADASLPPQVRSICFHIARHAKLSDCATVSFTVYRNLASPAWERTLALNVLEFVGTAAQRQEVLADLKAGLLGTNELIAHALPVTDWKHLTRVELTGILDSTRTEEDYGSGPMARVVKEELLPAADLPEAALLLESVMASLPRPVPGRPFARFPESDRPERAWLLDALPECYEHVLALLPPTADSYHAVCMEAAERIEAQRDSGFTDIEEFKRLQTAIALHPELRWRVALAIAQSEDVRASVNRLTWGASCLVTFGAADLPELTRRANSPESPGEERHIWFAVAVAVAFSLRHRRERTNALRTLELGGPDSERFRLVADEYAEWRRVSRQRCIRKAQERERKVERSKTIENHKSRLLAELEHIRDGTHQDSLRWLLDFSFSHLRKIDYSDAAFDAIATNLSPEIASAFEEGLQAYWPTVTPPDPSDDTDGSVPWKARIALAGLGRSLHDANSISALSATNAAKAAQLAVWERHGSPPWFNALARSHKTTVEAALTPWVVAEAQAPSPSGSHEVRGALKMALSCAPDVRQGLLAPLVQLVESDQISRHETLKVLINTLREDKQLESTRVEELCQSKLKELIGSKIPVGEMEWLRIWVDVNAPAAWDWFQQKLKDNSEDIETKVREFVRALGDLVWLPEPLSEEAAKVLQGILGLLMEHSSLDEAGDSEFFWHSPRHLREAIPKVFLRARGRIGHDSLVALLPTLADSGERTWVAGLLNEHAALDAAETANRTSEELKSIGSPFLSAPRTEAQLYEQVIARLEEIRKNLEEGPFSERDLFYPGMQEKFLQRWLAAKFRDTQNLRFSVHREEEVDDDNKTDIQLSCPAGNVCVEIKPVDAKRSYSAASLTGTLKTQIVGQYLRGTNSTRGVLVLMQLDNKVWDIPADAAGKPFAAGQPFAELIKYLETQAEAIKRESAGVNELAVFGIRCVV